MRQAITVCIALAALVAAGDNRNKIVRVPYELADTEAAVFDDIESISVSSNTYVGICELGDMAVRRKYIPSAVGIASMPSDLRYDFMAADGWEVPEAERHSKLYSLVYSCVTNMDLRTNLVNGVRVFPLTALTTDLEPFSGGWRDVGEQYVPVTSSGHGAAQGTFGFNGERFGGDLYGELESLLLTYQLVPADDSPDYAEAAKQDADTIVEAFVNSTEREIDFQRENFLARGGIKSGDPLRAIDPYGAYWWLKRLDTTPVIVPSYTYGSTSNEAWTVTIKQPISEEVLTTVAKGLVMAAAGDGEQSGELEKADTVRTESAHTAESGFPEISVTARYYVDSRNPRVWALVEAHSGSTDTGWINISATRVGRGTLYVDKMDTTYFTNRRIIDAGCYRMGFADEWIHHIKSVHEWIEHHTEYPGGIGYPHSSSSGYVRGVGAAIFGGAHRTAEYAEGLGVDQEMSFNSITYSGDGEARAAMRSLMSRYYEPEIVPIAENDTFSSTYTLHVDVPDISDSSSSSTTFRTRYIPDPDDPDGEEETGYYTPEGGTDNPNDFDENAPINTWPGWNGDGFDDDHKTTNPYGSDGTVRYRIICPAWIARDDGFQMGFETFDRVDFSKPMFLLDFSWNFE